MDALRGRYATSAAPGEFGRRRNDAEQRGFTLIELLVVLVVMGIALVLVGVKLTTGDRQYLLDASERIGLLLQYAAEKARVSGRMLGWSATRSGYAFQVQDPDTRQWLTLTDDDSLRQRQFDHDIRLLSASEDGVMLQNGQMVTFSSSGSNAVVDIVLGLDDERAAIKIAPTGNYEISLASVAPTAR